MGGARVNRRTQGERAGGARRGQRRAEGHTLRCAMEMERFGRALYVFPHAWAASAAKDSTPSCAFAPTDVHSLLLLAALPPVSLAARVSSCTARVRSRAWRTTGLMAPLVAASPNGQLLTAPRTTANAGSPGLFYTTSPDQTPLVSSGVAAVHRFPWGPGLYRHPQLKRKGQISDECFHLGACPGGASWKTNH